MAHIPDKLKHIFTDTVWAAAGLVMMNVTAQFLVYPFWHRTLGSEAYGNIIYLVSVMNTAAVSIGSGVSYARMKQQAGGETQNRFYILLMAAGTVLSLTLLLVLNAAGALHADRPNFILFSVLTLLTMWRCYSDVEYRLRVNYKGFFLYYLVIGAGYLAGILLFRRTGLWPLALIPGELAGLLLVLFGGSVFRWDKDGGEFLPVLRLTLLMVGSSALSGLIFNADRIVLRFFAGGTAVSIYYIATLLGKTLTLVTTPFNGVMVGYLARYGGKLTKRMMNRIAGVTIAGIVLAAGACWGASHIVIPFLYPGEYERTAPYLLIGSAAQAAYFAGNVLAASVVLRFTAARNQLLVNAVYAAAFAVICLPLAKFQGLGGFCGGLLAAALIRCGCCILLGYAGVIVN